MDLEEGTMHVGTVKWVSWAQNRGCTLVPTVRHNRQPEAALGLKAL